MHPHKIAAAQYKTIYPVEGKLQNLEQKIRPQEGETANTINYLASVNI